MSQWQDISTAPKDGTRILVGRFTGKPEAMREGWITVDWYRNDRLKYDYTGFGGFNVTSWPPTHWMPLPAPPPNALF